MLVMWSPLLPVWTKPAAKQLAKLPRDARAQVEASVNRYAATGVGDIKALKGMPGILRLRTGNYRTKFTILLTPSTMTILAVDDRKNAYD